MAVAIYSNVHGGLAGPALNALATLMLAFSAVLAGAGYGGYRLLTRGGGNAMSVLTDLAGAR
jgi:ABC-type spermidine/putrescine transport system permease subunit II